MAAMYSRPYQVAVTDTVRPTTPASKGATVGGDNDRPGENMILLHAPAVAERKNTSHRSKPVRNPKPFTVFQPIPGQNAKPIFTVRAYSLEQARALVAAKIAGETIVVPVSPDGASR